MCDSHERIATHLMMSSGTHGPVNRCHHVTVTHQSSSSQGQQDVTPPSIIHPHIARECHPNLPFHDSAGFSLTRGTSNPDSDFNPSMT